MPAGPKRVDVAINDYYPEVLAEIIVRNLGTKGFCTVDAGLEPEQLQDALRDVGDIDRADRFYIPPALIYDALLGPAGSTRIAHLQRPDRPDSSGASTDGEHLSILDGLMSELGECLEYEVVNLGFTMNSRTPAVLHESGTPGGGKKDLTEVEASEWMVQLFRAKIMCMVVLGPGIGTLELCPLDQSKEIISLDTQPGDVVFLRADAVSHRHACVSRSTVLSCFYLGDHSLSNKHHLVKEEDMQLTPVAKRLYDWVDMRLGVLKSKEQAQAELPAVPQGWLKAMNHAYTRGQRNAVKGWSCRFPTCFNPKAWTAVFNAGPDYATTIPILRWDHSKMYDPSPQAWKEGRTFGQHGAFADGVELFDAKMFGLAPAEVKGMDPCQRWTLEGGYDALVSGGMKKKDILGSFGAVYMAVDSQLEWNYVEKSEGSATGGSGCITSNRFSFCLGMKGPSFSAAAEQASGLAILHQCCQGISEKGHYVSAPFAMVGGIFLNLSPFQFAIYQSCGHLSEIGRCLSFNQSADGHIRSDGAAYFMIKPNVALVDGKRVVQDESPLGTISGSAVTHSGSAPMGLPTGPGLLEVMATTLRCSGIEPADIDAVECHGSGVLLADAVEHKALSMLFDSVDTGTARCLLGMKGGTANTMEAGGIAQLMRAIHSIRCGSMKAHVHLSQANPHLDLDTSNLHLPTETTEFGRRHNYVGLLGYGFGGMNVCLTAWGQMDDDAEYANTPTMAVKDKIGFWPAGGGQLDSALQPRKDYCIVGSMTDWAPKLMKTVGPGQFQFTVTLGENRWEEFQIWLDGDKNRCLYPGTSLGHVLGPDDAESSTTWVINGLPWGTAGAAADNPGALMDGDGDVVKASETHGEDAGEQGNVATGGEDIVTPDTGAVGTSYNVTLRIVGKYRSVDWIKVQ